MLLKCVLKKIHFFCSSNKSTLCRWLHRIDLFLSIKVNFLVVDLIGKKNVDFSVANTGNIHSDNDR